MDGDDERWIDTQLAREPGPEPDPLMRAEAAIDAYVRAMSRSMYRDDLIVDLSEPAQCSVCIEDVTRVVRPFCFNAHSD
jgi:hypothetical protein